MHPPCSSARCGHLRRWPAALGLALLASHAATGRAVAGALPEPNATAGVANAAVGTPPAPGNGRASWGQRLDNGVDLLLSVSGLKAAGPDLQGDRELMARVSRGAWSFGLVRGDRRDGGRVDAGPVDNLLARPDPAGRFALAQLQFQDGDARDVLQLRGRLYSARAQWLGTAGTWQGGEWRLRSTAWAGHTVTAGLQVQAPGQGRGVGAGEATDPRQTRWIGLDAQDEWRLAPTLRATAGLRLDRQGRAGTAPGPRAALAWQAAPGTVLKALIGTLRAASGACAGDCSNGGGHGDDLDLTARLMHAGARTGTHELTAEHQAGPGLALRGTAFRRSVRDAGMAGPGDRFHARGLRLWAEQSWERGARLSGSLALQRVADAHGTASVDVPSLLGQLALSMPLPVPGVVLAGELSGGRVGGGGVANLNLRLALRPVGLSLTLGLQRLPDTRGVRVELAGRF